MNLPLLLVSALLAALVTPPALAEETAPDVLVKSISEEVIAAIRQDKGIQAGDPRKIAELVEAKILPHFDFRHTTQLAMGVNWRRATPEQQEQLTREFRALLVRTYSGALAGYSDQVIEFRPLRAQPGDTEVTVRSQVRRSGAEPIDRIRPGEDRPGVEGLRYQGRWNQPGRHLPQRFRRGGAQPRHRRSDQPAFEQEPRRREAGVGEDLIESLSFCAAIILRSQ